MQTIAVTAPTQSPNNSFFVVRQLLIQAIVPEFPVADFPRGAALHIHVGTPEPAHDLYLSYTEPERLVFYTFCEADNIPEHWIATFNRCRDIWVPSEFCRATLARCGVCVPIQKIPLGVDATALKVEPEQFDVDKFTILWQGVRQRNGIGGEFFDGDRKRGYLVERAFHQSKITESRLILKSIPQGTPPLDIRIDPVWYIDVALSPRQLRKLYHEVDLLVWPTMGEGFGLIPLEAMACGAAVLVTNWSGTTEYLSDFPGASIDQFDLVDVLYNGVPARMASVSEDALIMAIRDARSSFRELRERRIERARMVRDKWDVRRVTKPPLLKAIQNVMAGEV